MAEKIKTFLIISAFSLIPTLLIWLPFLAKIESFWGIPIPKEGMATIVANYDGPLFLVVAKTFYNPHAIEANFSFPLPSQYYAAHFPLFPLLIKIFSLAIGFPYAMLLVVLLTSILASCFFYKFISLYLEKRDALFLTFVFSLFPARWLIVHSVGSPEPLFIASIIASVYYFKLQKYWLAGIWGAVAQLTKSPGILLFLAYLIYLTIPTLKNLVSVKKIEINFSSYSKFLPILLIPASLLSVFIIFKFTINDFFAYFHSGDNIHLIFPPFSIFNSAQSWVGTFWLEEIIFVYLFGAIGLINLLKKNELLPASFVAVFLFSIIFVSHRDLIRYSLPVVPFILLSFSDYIQKKEFKYVIGFLVIPIYLFSVSYISQNVMPIGNWAPFL